MRGSKHHLSAVLGLINSLLQLLCTTNSMSMISLSCFPASPDPGSIATLAASSTKWFEKQTALIVRAMAMAMAERQKALALNRAALLVAPDR